MLINVGWEQTLAASPRSTGADRDQEP
jgi:hypothetical protein